MKTARIVFGTLLVLSILANFALWLFFPITYNSYAPRGSTNGELLFLVTILPLAVVNFWLWAYPEEVKNCWKSKP